MNGGENFPEEARASRVRHACSGNDGAKSARNSGDLPEALAVDDVPRSAAEGLARAEAERRRERAFRPARGGWRRD